MASTLSVLSGVCFWRGLASKLETLIEKLNFSKQLKTLVGVKALVGVKTLVGVHIRTKRGLAGSYVR